MAIRNEVRPKTVAEFAHKYRVCRATVTNWRNAGYLDCLQVGTRVLITHEQEKEFVERHTKGAHSLKEVSCNNPDLI
jgi:hypothetical protein